MSYELDVFMSRRSRNPRQKMFFDSRASAWDEMSHHDPVKLDYITRKLDIRPGMRVLDVGTGTGVMIPYYLDRIGDGKVTAVDYSGNMIHEASMKYPESEVLEYRVQDIYDMDDSGLYDLAVCYSCFPHFPDPVLAVGILAEALKPEGRLCIAHSDSADFINRVHSEGGEDICTDYLPTMDVMQEILSDCGLETVFRRDDDDYYIVIGRKTGLTASSNPCRPCRGR